MTRGVLHARLTGRAGKGAKKAKSAKKKLCEPLCLRALVVQTVSRKAWKSNFASLPSLSLYAKIF
jgi:hypothetical protein